MTLQQTPPPSVAPSAKSPVRRRPGRVSLLAHGEPMLWLTGGALAMALVMIISLLALVVVKGAPTFWPVPVVQVTTVDGKTHMGEMTRAEAYATEPSTIAALPEAMRARAQQMIDEAGDGMVKRRLIRIGNFEITRDHFAWVNDYEVAENSYPQWAIAVERLTWGRFYGIPAKFTLDGEVVAEGPEAAWAKFMEFHGESRERYHVRRGLETHETGDLNAREERARLRLRQVELDHGKDSPRYAEEAAQFAKVKEETDAGFAQIRTQINDINAQNARYQLVFDTAQGRQISLMLADIVRAYPANQVADSLGAKWGIYLSRWWEFLTAEPREANSEGGVYPAIFGTVLMTLIMCGLVVPFGVMAALYIREYAKAGPVISVIRIAINNLAGVPSIVYGVFGLGFFCYIIGAGVDGLFFEAALPNPTFGKGGLIWASFTLALLTLPVVIVATEEALSAVPNSMREGSYACGASKWQTIKRIVLPRAMPGVMTGAILAMARGAGEVAPLMLVGAVKLAPELPFSFSPAEQFGTNRSFMHLGFHIYDLGFQSQNSEAAKPMVYVTTLLLILIIAFLNLAAIRLRSRLRRKFVASAF